MSDHLALALTLAIEDAGIPHDKAERVASVIVDVIHDNVATKSDIAPLATKVEAVGADVVRSPRVAPVPVRIGPCEFGELGAMVTVRCPQDYDPLMRQAGGVWEPGSRRWLVERRRIGPLVRNLRRATDPLFRRVGLDLDAN